MNMRRLSLFVAIEIETIWSNPEYRWHIFKTVDSLQLTVEKTNLYFTKSEKKHGA